MSVNFPFWFESPFRDRQTRRTMASASAGNRFCAMDIASGKWLGFELIGRPRDAYRAEDILRFLRRLFTEYGMMRRGPPVERGIWQSKRLTGYTVTDSAAAEEEVQRPGMDEPERERIVGGSEFQDPGPVRPQPGRQRALSRAASNFLQAVMSAIAEK